MIFMQFPMRLDGRKDYGGELKIGTVKEFQDIQGTYHENATTAIYKRSG
jgi:hypothetical protein